MLGEDLLSAYGRLEQEVADAIAQEDDIRKVVPVSYTHLTLPTSDLV